VKDPLKDFIVELERSLYTRYLACNDGAATPSSILRAVLNAVDDAHSKAYPRRRKTAPASTVSAKHE
jgi:hypothetical protein